MVAMKSITKTKNKKKRNFECGSRGWPYFRESKRYRKSYERHGVEKRENYNIMTATSERGLFFFSGKTE